MSRAKSLSETPMEPLGLYLHIPYCAAVCPYCDFAKTANFTAQLQGQYLAKLEAHVRGWWEEGQAFQRGGGFTSVFFGGGTPSLFTHEYASLFAALRPMLASGAEISLEANPDDLSRERLLAWQQLGVTRLSVGVQTFEDAGLTVLKRTHSAEKARTGIELARSIFPALNVDLIYGWPQQTMAQWRADLATLVTLETQHISLYSLTYESRTPLGRLAHRGRVVRAGDDHLADLYEAACDVLGSAGYRHEEVSNWSKPGASCRHNWLYWSDHSYLGVGAGAHGYLADSSGCGLRYAYERSDRLFVQKPLGPLSTVDPAALAQRFGITVDAQRSLGDWFTELVGSGLRTTRGIGFDDALTRAGLEFRPAGVLTEAFAQGILMRRDGRLYLRPDEWFREAGWGAQLLHDCVPAKHH